MTFSPHPVSYCTNVHPGQTVDEVLAGLQQFTAPVRKRTGELAAGLWLARPVVTELLDDESQLEALDRCLQDSELSCYTLNTFPYGNFHDARVKENVYLPDWTDDRRWFYTQDCARVLARLLPSGVEGSLSTVPLGFKGFDYTDDFVEQCTQPLIELARFLEALESETGRTIRLAIEPEPYCLLETTDETLQFFDLLLARAADDGSLESVRKHIGVCYDICHQAVEFEDVADSIHRLDEAGIRLAKIHISSAVRLENPAEDEAARQALDRYLEPRYLHQTLGRNNDGQIVRMIDLTEDLALNPSGDFLQADEWRVHFHVPVDAESLGPLGTTRNSIRSALSAVKELDYAPHLEVETYTWEVLPDGESTPLVEGLTAEILATRELLKNVD